MLIRSFGLSTICLGVVTGSAVADSLERIQVSASRTQSSVFQTPVALSTSFVSAGAEHPAEQLNQLPGTWITQASGQEQLTAIRSPVLTGAGGCSEFYLSQDQIPLRASGFCNVNQLFEAHTELAEAIEITRGPSSSIKGSNAVFGAINVQLPHTLSTNRATLSLKEKQYQQINLALQGEELLALLSLQHDSGYRDSSGFEQQKLSLKHLTDVSNWQVESSLSASHLNQGTASFIEGKDLYRDKALRRSNPTPDAYRKAYSIRGHSRWIHQSNSTQLMITPYFRSNQMRFLMHFLPWQPVETNQHASLGNQLRLSHTLQPDLTFHFGADLELTQGELLEDQEHPSPFATSKFPQGVHYDYKVTQKSGSIDLGLSWQLTHKLTLEAALRQDQIHYDYQNRLASGPACAPDATECRFYRPQSDTYKFSQPSVHASLGYLSSPQHFSYLSVHHGFRAPHTSELFRLQEGQQQSQLNPVEIINLEIGHKVNMEQFQCALALFGMERREGIFQNSERHYVGGSKTRHLGIEYEFSWNFATDWQLSWNGSYAKHTYLNSPDLLNSNAQIKGNDIDTAPRKLNWISLKWQASQALSVQLSQQRQGSYFLNPENSQSYPGHQLWQLAAYWQFKDIDLGVRVDNLIDKAYAKRADVSFDTPRYIPGEGRQAQLSLTYHWQD